MTLYDRKSVHRLRFNNTVKKAIAVIFVNTYTKAKAKESEKQKKETERSLATAQALFRDVFEIEDVRVFRNLSKGQILEQFESLRRESKHFNEVNEGEKVLSIMVRWIGASTDFSQENNEKPVDGQVMNFTSEFGEQSFDKCAITFDGQAINM